MFVALLEVAVTLTAVYFGLGVVCSALAEWVAAGLRWRAELLESGVRGLLGDARDQDGRPLAEAFFDDPLVRPLCPPVRSADRRPGRPSYLPARMFTDTVLHLVHPPDGGAEPPTFNDLARLVDRLPPSDLRDNLRAFARASGHDVEQVRGRIDQWYHAAMDRVAGWYKRRMGLTLLGMAAALAFTLGVDTLELTRAIWGEAQSRAARADVVALSRARLPATAPAGPDPAHAQAAPRPVAPSADSGQAAVTAPPSAAPPRPVDTSPPPAAKPAGGRGRELPEVLIDRVSACEPPDCQPMVVHLGGMLLTAVAVAVAASFWFDLLNRWTNLRLAGPRPVVERPVSRP